MALVATLILPLLEALAAKWGFFVANQTSESLEYSIHQVKYGDKD
jgi:peptidoglycan/xylan/chitin deacetylase (PgdA/CDA1 family)